ncbi:MAG: hypothetical protein HY736_24215 [Verrucomicrobia bacterium]|nr:hypothetical protein [Verrucomicrobiota bacterium]
MATLSPVPNCGFDGRQDRARRWFFVVLGALPFQLLLLQHLGSGELATGFLQYDSAYYVANGREVFERGNGFAHPNPYDPSPNAPVIYFHWLTWLLGFGVKVLGADPGALFAAMGVGASLLCSALMLRLVEAVLPEARGRLALFLLTMWGGGALCLGALVANLAAGRPFAADWFAFDLENGWWFPNWGRNLVLPTEAVYHSLVAAAWWAVFKRRWGLAIGAVGALAATHPFSGSQHLLILCTWLGVVAARERTRAAVVRLTVVAAILGAFAAYNFGFLNSFPEHRALTAKWSLGWTMPMATLVLAVAPPAAVALWRLRRRESWTEADKFFAVAWAVTFLLMKHDWFVAARQPAHFSRGYHWLPVWLMALPQLQAWGLTLAARAGRRALIVAGGAAAMFLVSDNAAFLLREFRDGQPERLYLTPAQRDVFRWMEQGGLRGVFLCVDTRLSYLAATFTSVRPYLGHINNTPDVHGRWRQVAAWHRNGGRGPWLEHFDYVLVERANPPAAFDGENWREIHRNQDYVLFGRFKETPAKP